MEKIRAAVVQFEHVAKDKSANMAKVRKFVKKAAKENVQVLCFPECCITGYWYIRRLDRKGVQEISEPVPEGPSSQELMQLARKHDVIVGAGLVEAGPDGKFYNTYVVAIPDGTFHKHRKIHSFENEAIDSGSQYTVFDTPLGWKVGVLICYDNNIQENVRMTRLLGADVIMAPHQTGGCELKNPNVMGRVEKALWDNRKQDRRKIQEEFRGDKGRGWLLRWLPSRAHDNGVFYLFANGVGVDDDEVRTGNAMIIDPYGRIVSETGKADDAMVVADLDPVLFERNTGRRWIVTRRPDLYSLICQRTGQEEDTRKVRFEHENQGV
jgi:predicted amidohydrolase